MSRGSGLLSRAVELYGDESFRAGWEEGLIDVRHVHGLIAYALFRADGAPSPDEPVLLDGQEQTFFWSDGTPPEGANVKTKLSPSEYMVFAAGRRAATKLCKQTDHVVNLLGAGGSISAQHAFYRPPLRAEDPSGSRLTALRLGEYDLQMWWAFSLSREDDPVGVVVHARWRNLTQLQRAFTF